MKLTIVMPTYNGKKYIKEAIDSILNQTFDDFELIIFDDASTDDTPQMIHDYADARIRYVRNPVNVGQALSFNIGFKMAQGEYIAVMDDDDVCLPEKFAKQIAYMDSHPEVDILGTNIILFPERLENIAAQGRQADWLPTEDAIIKSNILSINGSSMIQPSMVVRAKFFHENKLAFPIRRMSIDSGFWVECVERGARFAALKEVLLYKRNHDNQVHVVNKPQWEPEKKFLRKKLLGIYYPHASNFHLEILCNLFNNEPRFTPEDFNRIVALTNEVVKDQRSYRGESKPQLLEIFKQRLLFHKKNPMVPVKAPAS